MLDILSYMNLIKIDYEVWIEKTKENSEIQNVSIHFLDYSCIIKFISMCRLEKNIVLNYT